MSSVSVGRGYDYFCTLAYLTLRDHVRLVRYLVFRRDAVSRAKLDSATALRA